MKKANSLELVTRADQFFHELVVQALGRQKVAPRPETEFYLVSLLTKFMASDRLYLQDADGRLHEEPLALLLKQAVEAQQPKEKNALLRHVGDVSLYVAGFFQDSLHRKHVDVDYYINMGGNAYSQVAVQGDPSPQSIVYQELSERFSRFVDVFAEVSEKTAPKTEKDLLRIYDLWQKTRSERAAKTLKEAGILTTDTKKKDVQ